MALPPFETNVSDGMRYRFRWSKGFYMGQVKEEESAHARAGVCCTHVPDISSRPDDCINCATHSLPQLDSLL